MIDGITVAENIYIACSYANIHKSIERLRLTQFLTLQELIFQLAASQGD